MYKKGWENFNDSRSKRRYVLDLFTSFNEAGQSIVMVTHDINSARRGNRIIYIKDGKVAGECNLEKYSKNDDERNKRLSDFLVRMGW